MISVPWLLSQPENRDSYVRMLFFGYSLACVQKAHQRLDFLRRRKSQKTQRLFYATMSASHAIPQPLLRKTLLILFIECLFINCSFKMYLIVFFASVSHVKMKFIERRKDMWEHLFPFQRASSLLMRGWRTCSIILNASICSCGKFGWWRCSYWILQGVYRTRVRPPGEHLHISEG